MFVTNKDLFDGRLICFFQGFIQLGTIEKTLSQRLELHIGGELNF